ncbi:MAG TPA: hypothetical protein VFO41_05745 [Alphaproteobacteria bacterium]|nr:hypothetical protein [Alphaproteobacteria bacterium]
MPTPRIEGRIDASAVERAREALRVQTATGAIKGMTGREDGARQAAEALRRWLRD